MQKEIERVGIPTAQISALPPLASSVGASRIIEGKAINNPLGDPTLPRPEEMKLRRTILMRALEALHTEVQEPPLVVRL